MRRLSLQIYLTVIAVLALFAVLLSVTWMALHDNRHEHEMLAGTAALLGEIIPPDSASQAEVEAALKRIGEHLQADVTLRSARGEVRAAHGEPIPATGRAAHEVRWHEQGTQDIVAALTLPDGRRLLLRHRPPRRRGAGGWFTLLALLLVATGLGAYPLVRRLTGRLERLRSRVDALGAGNLAARVAVEGNDEVAALARTLNRAAERIESLVGSQRDMLAMASHELRSPLGRLRVAIDLLLHDPRPALRAQIERDIIELDELVGELLLASRLESGEILGSSEDIDLLALAAEECAAVEADLTGSHTELRGDARLLRRLVRNLLQNAARHAPGARAEVIAETDSDGSIVLRVADRGPGIAAAEREKIFAPFYRVRGTAEGEGGGVGLGLYLVKQITHWHGGTVSCSDRPGGGTVFEVRFAKPRRTAGPRKQDVRLHPDGRDEVPGDRSDLPELAARVGYGAAKKTEE